MRLTVAHLKPSIVTALIVLVILLTGGIYLTRTAIRDRQPRRGVLGHERGRHRRRALHTGGPREDGEEILESVRMEQHPAIQHTLPPHAELVMTRITGGIAVVADRVLGEPDLQHGTQAHDVCGELRIVQDPLETGE